MTILMMKKFFRVEKNLGHSAGGKLEIGGNEIASVFGSGSVL